MRTTIATMAVLAGLVPACGSSHDAEVAGAGGRDGVTGSNQAGGPVAQADLPALLADVACESLAPCCAQQGMAVDVELCQSGLTATFASSQGMADPTKYGYDPDAAGVCLDRLRQRSGGCGGSAELSVGDVQCGEAFLGTVPPGGACASPVECEWPEEGAATCRGSSEDASGTCISRPTAGEGEPCYETCTVGEGSRSCSSDATFAEPPVVRPRCFTNDGLYCADGGVCAAQSREGGPCTEDEACRPGLICGMSRACERPRGEGEACGYEACEEGLFCRNGTCVPQRSAGTPCEGVADECLDGYCEGGTCVEAGDLGAVGTSIFCMLLSSGD